ncbi:Cell cycle protein, FtsW/RodA/SpoVE family, partial [Candidatus Arthromitus sp. SFB-1]
KFRNPRLVVTLMIITIILLLLVFLFPPINGAQRWIQLGPLSLQPSEMAKYVVVIYLARSLDKKGDEIKKFWSGVFPTLMVAGIFAGLVLAEKNLSITSVIMFVAFILITVSGAKKKHLFTLGGIGLAAGMTLILAAPYRLKRLMSFMDPWADPRGDGYQLIQSLLALGSGGFLGLGFGMSRQKAYYLPEPHNDFIFSVIAEETGFLGGLIIIFLFAILIWRGIVIAIKCKDNFGTLLAMGITSVIAIQAIINLAVVTGTMPVTGVPLPFISYGGSSLLFNMTAVGILLNVSRNRVKW